MNTAEIYAMTQLLKGKKTTKSSIIFPLMMAAFIALVFIGYLQFFI